MKGKTKGFTLVELMIVVVILGILAAIAIPAFIKYIRQSKTSEAKENLGYIYKASVTYYQEEHTQADGSVITLVFPGNAATKPAATPKGVRTIVPAGDWEGDVVWNGLRFTVTEPLYYKYSYASTGSATIGEGANFTATANGDLDGDGAESTFIRSGNVAGGEIVGKALIETNPTE